MTAINSIIVKHFFTLGKLWFTSSTQAGNNIANQMSSAAPIRKLSSDRLIRPIGKQAKTTSKAVIDKIKRIFINSFYIIKYKTFKLEYLLQRKTKIVNCKRVLKKVIQKAIIINKTYRKH